MSETHPTLSEKSPPPATHWPSVIQFTFSSLAILLSWGVFGVMFTGGVLQFYAPIGSPELPAASFVLAATGLFVGILLLPSAAFSLARLMGREINLGKTWTYFRRIFHPKRLILFLPAVILAGHWAKDQEGISWLVMPFVQILAASIPVLWLAWLGIRKLLHQSPQRTWGIFSSGLVLGPVIIFSLEIAVLVFIVFIFVFILALNPEIVEALEPLILRMEYAKPDSTAEMEVLSQIYNNPVVIFSSLTFLSVIIPLIEEAIKPIGVWLLAGRNLTPKEGFTAGVISGAGYALFENLGNTSIGTDWTLIVIGRIGPTVLHIFTTGLIGYALALALKEKRYLRLGSAYLLSVVIHGLWNGLTTTSSIAGLDLENALLPSYWMPAGSIALILLAAGIFALLIRANRELRSTETDTQEMGLTKETIQPKEQNT
jgi:hypothetical protein